LNILWLSHSAGAFGAERAMMESVTGLCSAGHSVTVVLPADSGERSPLWSMTGARITDVQSAWWMGARPATARDRLYSLRMITKAALQLRRMLKSESFDAVVTNTLTVPTAALAARGVGLPHVWYVHEFGDRDHSLLFHFGERLSLAILDRCSRAVIVNSPAVAAHFERHIAPGKLQLLDYAVEIDRAEADVPAHEGLRLVIVGQVEPSKGQEDAIRALAVLAQRNFLAHLDVVGPVGGEYQQSLAKLVGDLCLADRVHFAGAVLHPGPWFRAADIALMCSRNEAFGRVTVEAMKLGRPVIGARSGGTADLIEEGRTGLFYTPGNAEELADQIARLCADPDLRQSLGKEASERANGRFSTERHTHELLRILKNAVADRR
jgi:glycosyltransferase involved in cell wall biosynthesis